MRRFIYSAVAVALLIVTGTVRANTIQPILQSVTNVGVNDYKYVYDIQVTSNNGITNGSVGAFESGLIMIDFNGLIGGPLLSSLFGDITVGGDWTTGTAATGLTSILSSTTYVGGTDTKISGNTPPNSAQAPDSSSVANIELKYNGSVTGSDINPTGGPRSLIHLELHSTIGLVLLQATLSRDTGPDQVNRPTENFSYLAPNNGGGPFLPLPSTAGLGLVLLGGLGFGRARRANLA